MQRSRLEMGGRLAHLRRALDAGLKQRGEEKNQLEQQGPQGAEKQKTTL